MWLTALCNKSAFNSWHDSFCCSKGKVAKPEARAHDIIWKRCSLWKCSLERCPESGFTVIYGCSKCLMLSAFSKLYPLLPEASGYISAALKGAFQGECFRTMQTRRSYSAWFWVIPMDERDKTVRQGSQPFPSCLWRPKTNSLERMSSKWWLLLSAREPGQSLSRPPSPCCQVWLAGKMEVKPGPTPMSSNQKQKGSGSFASTIYKITRWKFYTAMKIVVGPGWSKWEGLGRRLSHSDVGLGTRRKWWHLSAFKEN